MWDDLVVDGFRFDSANAYAKAKREAEKIEYIRLKMDLSRPDTAAKVYYKLLEKQSFETIVGLSFLKQLRDYVIAEGVVREEDIKNITVSEKQGEKVENYGDETALELSDEARSTAQAEGETSGRDPFEDNEKEKEKKLKTVIFYYRQKAKKTNIVIAGLVVIIIVMFIITLTSDRSPFADAEAAMQDKYAFWAEELGNWEAELNAREAGLLTVTPTPAEKTP